MVYTVYPAAFSALADVSADVFALELHAGGFPVLSPVGAPSVNGTTYFGFLSLAAFNNSLALFNPICGIVPPPSFKLSANAINVSLFAPAASNPCVLPLLCCDECLLLNAVIPILLFGDFDAVSVINWSTDSFNASSLVFVTVFFV